MEKVLCFALQQEAQQWINICDARLVFQKKSLRLYKGKEFYCLVSGLGALNMAGAIGWLNAYLPEEKILWNIGCAAGSEEQLYTWYRINQLCSEDEKEAFYPEIISIDGVKQAGLKSFHKFVDKNTISENSPFLIDMEGLAFALQASLFCDSGKIQLLKWVSDSGDASFYKNSLWKHKYEEKIEELLDYIKEQNQLLESILKKHKLPVDRYVEQVSNKIPISFSLQVQLKNAILFALNNKGEKYVEAELNRINKESRNKIKSRQEITKLISILNSV